MRVGLDLDNTIVCYDEAFHLLASEHRSIPDNLPKTKEQVKAHLQAQGRNDFWTELQGLAYGPRMETAAVFPGFENFIRAARKSGVELFIVSHRSPKPYSGLDYDLHAAGREWLRRRSWVSSEGVDEENIFFESQKMDKIRKIAELKLDYFVDDLIEILTNPEFPAYTKKIHFLPSSQEAVSKSPSGEALRTAKNWQEILNFFEGLWKTTKSKM